MSKKQRILAGQRFGKLLVLESCGRGKDRHYMSKVKCECGVEYLVTDSELIHGRRKTCAKCSKVKETHGMTNTRIFHIWQSMKQRCSNDKHRKYVYYGARGIRVCSEWNESFESFYNWAINNGYKEHLTIDRIDVNGNYEPDNCRWVNTQVQANNKRNNRVVNYNGENYTIAELSALFGINYSCLYYRVQNGWDMAKALNIQPRIGRNQYEKV